MKCSQILNDDNNSLDKDQKPGPSTGQQRKTEEPLFNEKEFVPTEDFSRFYELYLNELGIEANGVYLHYIDLDLLNSKSLTREKLFGRTYSLSIRSSNKTDP